MGSGLLLEVYWAYRAFKGETFDIPVISNLVRNQGWGITSNSTERAFRDNPEGSL
jgi:hypothetical protein